MEPEVVELFRICGIIIFSSLIFIVILINYDDIIESILNKLYYLFDIPIVGQYYIDSGDWNPYDKDIIFIKSYFKEYVTFQIIKGEYKNQINTLYIENFISMYDLVCDVSPLLEHSSDVVEIPLFEIDKFNVYNLDKYWIIVPKGSNDIKSFKKYRSLSIALIDHNL